MGMRNSSILRYIAALLAIASSIFFMFIYIKTAICSLVCSNYLVMGFNSYVPSFIFLIIIIAIYFFILLEGLLMMFRSRHIGLGILLILEAIVLFPFLLQPNSFILSVISSLILFISGLLILIYKPTTKKSIAFPKQARRCISLGAYLILFAFLIDVGYKLLSVVFILRSFLSQSPSQSMGLGLSNYLLLIISYLLMAITIFLIALYISFKLRTEDKKQISKYSRFALYMVLLVVVLITSMSLLFQVYGTSFLTSNSALESVLSSSNSYGNTANLTSFMAVVSSAYFPVLGMGIILLLLGGLSGLAFSKKLGFIEYILANRRPVLYCVVFLVVVYVAFFFYSSYHINTDNNMALSSLNSKIQLYGGNLRYLLANESVYNDALVGTNTSNLQAASAVYETLPLMSSPQSNLSSVFTFGNYASYPSGQQSSAPTNQELSRYDWYNYNPIMRTIEIDTLFNLGFLTFGSDVQNNYLILQDQKLFIPQKVSTLQSMYELQSYGVGILLSAESLSQLFNMTEYPHGLFFGQNISAARLPVNALGVGISAFPAAGPAALTSMANGSFYDVISGSDISNGWPESLYVLYGSGGHGIPDINNNTFDSNFFYTLALNQYVYYYSSQIFYNQTILPNIDFIGYLNNTLIINLGNLNLTNPQISLSIGGNQTTFKRYYNYLIVDNKHLATGYHKVVADVNGLALSQSFYVSPVILGLPYYSYSGHLSFSIPNPYPSSLNITNVSVRGGVIPQPSITPTNISDLLYNWSSDNTWSAVLANVTYVKFNFYQKKLNYYKTYFTISNTTSYNIPINTRYVINRNDSLRMNFTVPSPNAEENYIPVTFYYTVTFNTNYGPEHVILQAPVP